MDADSEVSVVNIVSSGKLDVELDLAAVAEDLRQFDFIDDVEHSRRSGNRLNIRYEDNETLGILAPSGVYVFTGAETHSQITEAKKYLMQALSELGIISTPEPPSNEVIDKFETQNIVTTADLGYEINLNNLAIGLGFENIEYEPEQFPGLVFRPPSGSCTILIFSSGKVVITGATEKSDAKQEYDELKERISKILNTS